MTDPDPDLVLLHVRPWARTPDGDTVDVHCADGQITAIVPATGGTAGHGDATVVDGRGGVVIPALVDAHAHLDSTRLGLPFRPHDAEPGLAGLVAADRRGQRDEEVPVAERATHTLGVTIAHGATAVRSHAQVDPGFGLARLEGILAAREAHAERADVEVVAFPQAGILRSPGTESLLAAAVQAGADLVGGLDPAGFDGDPGRHLDIVFDLADRLGVGIDIHLHDAGELGAWEIEQVCARTVAAGMQGLVTISHAFGLGEVDDVRRATVIDRLAGADVALTSVAPGSRTPLPRAALASARVRLGLGQDGIRDFWSPWGTGDMLERTWQLAHREGLRRDEAIEHCVAVASLGGRSVMNGRDGGDGEATADAGIAVGDPAELLVLEAGTVTEAVMDRPRGRIVVHRGRVVARDGALV